MTQFTRPIRPLLLLLCLLGFIACTDSAPPDETRAAPDFSLRDLDGNPVRLSDHLGKVVLLDFWATWCPPCRAAMPHLAKLQTTYRDDGFAVLGMNLDQNSDDLTGFLESQTVNYPIVRVDEQTRVAYGGVAQIPQAFVVDRKGNVRKKFSGYDHRIASEMDQLIQALLEEAP